MAYFFWQGSTAGVGIARYDWNYPPNWKVSNNYPTFSTLSQLPSATAAAPGPQDQVYIGHVSNSWDPNGIGYGLTARSALLYGGCSGTMPIRGNTSSANPMWLNAVKGVTGTTFTSSLQSVAIDLGHRKGPSGATGTKYPFPWLGGGIVVGSDIYNWAANIEGMDTASLTGVTASRAAEGLNLKVNNDIKIFTTGRISNSYSIGGLDGNSYPNYSVVNINSIPSKGLQYSGVTAGACYTSLYLLSDYYMKSYGGGNVTIQRYKQPNYDNYGAPLLFYAVTIDTAAGGTSAPGATSSLRFDNYNPRGMQIVIGNAANDPSYSAATILTTKIPTIGNIQFSTGTTFGVVEIGAPYFAGVLPFEPERSQDVITQEGSAYVAKTNVVTLYSPVFNYTNATTELGYRADNTSGLLAKSALKLYDVYGMSDNLSYYYTPVIRIGSPNNTYNHTSYVSRIPTISTISSTVINTPAQRSKNVTSVPWRLEIGSSLSCTAAAISNLKLTTTDTMPQPEVTEININTLNLSKNSVLELDNTPGFNNWYFGSLTANAVVGGINFIDPNATIIGAPGIRLYNTQVVSRNYDSRGSVPVAVPQELLADDGAFSP